MILLLLACSDNGIFARPSNTVGVSIGDFDDYVPHLQRLEVATTLFDGLISDTTYTSEDIETEGPVERLLSGSGRYEALFLSSGTRGLGDQVYNRNEPDDQSLVDEGIVEQTRTFVRNGGDLMASDWSYDLIETAWPDAIDFVGDGSFDDAQRGEPGVVVADVVDETLADVLSMDQLVVTFDYSNWAVMTGVGEDVTVYLRGEVTYFDGEQLTTVPDAPLMVGFDPGEGRGTVVFHSFHANAQTPAVMDTLIGTLIEPLPALR